jgi:hypothetical protein
LSLLYYLHMAERRCAFAFLAVVVAGCAERGLVALTDDVGVADLSATYDLAVSEMTVPVPDLSVPIDMVTPLDLQPDLRTLDLAGYPRTTVTFELSSPVSLGTMGSDTFGIAAGDFNNDGYADVATANWGNTPAGSVSILLADGKGGLSLAGTFYAGFPSDVVAGDVDRDGKEDLIVAGDGIRLFLGNGDGTFRLRSQHTTNCTVLNVALTDLDGDGWLDALGTVSGCGTGLTRWAFGASGTVLSVTQYTVGQTAGCVAAGHFIGTGLPGVVFCDGGALATGASSMIDVFDPISMGMFSAPTSYATKDQLYGVASGDFNRDGRDDIVVGELSGGFGIFLSQSTGGLAAEQHTDGSRMSSVVVADFNTDGLPDFAVAEIAPTNAVSVYLGKGDGTFQAPVSIALATPIDLAVGDVDGDGLPDLIVADVGMQVSVLLNRSY